MGLLGMASGKVKMDNISDFTDIRTCILYLYIILLGYSSLYEERPQSACYGIEVLFEYCLHVMLLSRSSTNHIPASDIMQPTNKYLL